MGYQWGKNPLGAAGWKARAIAAEEKVMARREEITRLQTAVADARAERNAVAHELEKVRRNTWNAVEDLAGKVERLRDRNARNAGRVRMLAGDLRDAREGLLAGVDQMQNQWATVLELRRRLAGRASRVRMLVGDLRDARLIARLLERTLEQEREANRLNVQQLEQSLAVTHARAAEAEKKAAAPGPEVAVWETRVRDLEGALRDQQSMAETWKHEANDAARAVKMLRGAIQTARFNAVHTKAETDSVLAHTQKFGYRYEVERAGNER